MEEIMGLIILGAVVLLLYFIVPYLKTLLDKQKRESMENICETKYHMNKYKNRKIENPYSYSDDIDNTTLPPIVTPNLPVSIPSMSPTLQTLNKLTNTYNKNITDDNIENDNDTSSSFNIVGKNNRITGFFTDTSFYSS